MRSRDTNMKTEFFLSDSVIRLAACSHAPQNDMNSGQPYASPSEPLEEHISPVQNKSKSRSWRPRGSSASLALVCFIWDVRHTIYPIAKISQKWQRPGREVSPQKFKVRRQCPSEIHVPTLKLPPAYLCPRGSSPVSLIIHALSPNCPSYPVPTFLR